MPNKTSSDTTRVVLGRIMTVSYESSALSTPRNRGHLLNYNYTRVYQNFAEETAKNPNKLRTTNILKEAIQGIAFH